MFTDTPFEAVAKTMFPGAEKFYPAAALEAVKPLMDNLKVWGELGQNQAEATQAAAAESFEAFKGISEPQAAFEALKTGVEKGVALAAKHVQEATALSVEQFNASVDLIQKSHPAPEAFAYVGQGLKAAASSFENAMTSALNASNTVPAAVVKKARTA